MPVRAASGSEWVWVMRFARPPSEPQIVGPMPGVSDGPTTTAPAPSPSRKLMERSVGSMKSLIFSAPMTSTCLASPDAHQRVGLAHAVAVPGARGGDVVRGGRGRAEPVGDDRGAQRGSAWKYVTVETMTASRSAPVRPASSSARRAACSQRSSTSVSAPARRRVTMPVRWRIHSSELSMGPATSSLVTTFSPRTPPRPRIRVYFGPEACCRVLTRSPCRRSSCVRLRGRRES